MNPYYYHNAADQRFLLPERSLEPSDCWNDAQEEEDEEEEEPSGRTYYR